MFFNIGCSQTIKKVLIFDCRTYVATHFFNRVAWSIRDELVPLFGYIPAQIRSLASTNPPFLLLGQIFQILAFRLISQDLDKSSLLTK